MTTRSWKKLLFGVNKSIAGKRSWTKINNDSGYSIIDAARMCAAIYKTFLA
jgi:hypothetical protein